jgi:hypothetical protein
MSNISILGSKTPLMPGESRHFTLRWTFQNVPTNDPGASILRLKYHVQNSEGEILFARNLSLLPEVGAWDVIVEVPPSYHERKVTLVAESEQANESATACADITVKI